jgi:mannosyltransferase OCH1-like enzyme
MISKIVHFCSFGEKSVSTNEKWIDAFPGYIFIRWNEANFKLDQHPYAAKVYAMGRIDLLENYVKVWALYNFGGFALSDGMVIKKSFDDLLWLSYVIGLNNDDLTVSNDIIGSSAGYKFFEDLLDFYNSINDEDIDLPFSEVVYRTMKTYGYYFFLADVPDMFVDSNKYITLFSKSMFSPLTYDSYGRITSDVCNEFTYTLNFHKS